MTANGWMNDEEFHWLSHSLNTRRIVAEKPHFPALWSNPMAFSGASSRKQIPSNDHKLLILKVFSESRMILGMVCRSEKNSPLGGSGLAAGACSRRA